MRPTPVLVSLVLLDVCLAAWGFFFPAAWYRFFHGADYIDPQGLLRRCAANWLAFAVIEAIALVRWRQSRDWLRVVAGLRLGDMLTDVTVLVFASSLTPMAWVAFPIAGIGNLLLGVWLFRTKA